MIKLLLLVLVLVLLLVLLLVVLLLLLSPGWQGRQGWRAGRRWQDRTSRWVRGTLQGAVVVIAAAAAAAAFSVGAGDADVLQSVCRAGGARPASGGGC
jgi:hypothetical protein